MDLAAFKLLGLFDWPRKDAKRGCCGKTLGKKEKRFVELHHASDTIMRGRAYLPNAVRSFTCSPSWRYLIPVPLLHFPDPNPHPGAPAGPK